MFELTKIEINKIADEANFNRNMTEKVLRLFSILTYINNSEFSNMLVLKGGTAINLFLLDLPRLSVDIDLDFNLPINRNDMNEKRKAIDHKIRGYMSDEGYYLSDKSKFSHSLDSYVFSYNTLSGCKDVLKIEINYADRVHVLNSVVTNSSLKLNKTVMVRRLSNEELIGSKINALITRTTPRDVYDVYNLYKNNYIKNNNLIRKIAIFYLCLGNVTPIDFDSLLLASLKRIENISYKRIRETLIPLLHKGIVFDINDLKDNVYKIVKNLFVLDNNDLDFIANFNNKIYKPDLLFSGYETEVLTNHPMGIWKCK